MVLPQSCGNFYEKSRLNSENATVIYFGFLNGSRHLVGTDVKKILEIPCPCWIFQDSFPFLITRRSRGSNPVSATKNESSPFGLLFVRCSVLTLRFSLNLPCDFIGEAKRK